MTARYLRLFLVVAWLAQGCAAQRPVPQPASQPAARDPDNVVVLLADPDGHVGRIIVSNSQGSQELDQPRAATEIADASRAPSAPSRMEQSQIARIFGEALAAQPSLPVRYMLYFDPGSTQLTAESRTLIPEVIRTIRERHSNDVSVVGHSDTTGNREYNYRLSLMRAQAVRQLIVDAGVDPSFLEITSHGKDNPLIPTGDNVAEPRNRRVEITVR
ncbi:MAG TPA: OmpA family protein [Candidatus Methylomirabilis sp.]|nr:OmpA family protein [Candidatus Methylomirabilis sp.]HSB79182.1 OmpA family protein [Candidatus Methylomirabilis sp.]